MADKKTTQKKRNWAFVLYPESAAENWKQLIAETGLQAAISPLHDSDVNPSGEAKKAHYHVILSYSGPTSYNVVKSLSVDVLNGTVPQALEQIRGYYRYFTHKDNPEKFQYHECDISTINGFNISDYVELTKSEVMLVKKQLQHLIRNLDILEYSDLIDILLDSDMGLEYEVASNNTYFFDKYICSRRHKLKQGYKDSTE